MSVEHLKRLDNLNYYAKYFLAVPAVDAARFAILSDPEREEFLKRQEKLLNNILAQREGALNN